MGILRGVGKSLGKVILTVSLMLLIVATGLAGVTEHDRLKSIFSGIIDSQIESQIESSGLTLDTATNEQIQETYEKLLETCGDSDTIELPILEIKV